MYCKNGVVKKGAVLLMTKEHKHTIRFSGFFKFIKKTLPFYIMMIKKDGL